jgi:zinc protease
MRSKQIILVTTLFLCSLAGVTMAGGIKLPEYETRTLDNGLRVQVMRMSTVPMVSFELWIDAGAASATGGQEGIAALTAEALRRGSGDLDAAAFASALDQLGARLATDVSADRTRLAMDLLVKDFDRGLKLLSDAVIHPTLDDGEIERLAARMSEEILQSKENPRFVLSDYHRANLFGNHPYARPVDGTEVSLPTLDAAGVRAFHRDHYGAQRSILTVVGDIDVEEVFEKISRMMQDMPRSRRESVQLSAPTQPSASRVMLVNKVDTPQTWFMVGSIGPSWTDREDFAATEIVRTVFGGRFTSWLNSELRIKSGLTYGARYNIQRMKSGGYVAISTFTATETTKDAIDLALTTLDRLHDVGLSPAELASAKAYVLGQAPYRYETASDLARAISELAFYDLSRAEIDELFTAINEVELEDCHRAIEHWFARENLVMTAVGVASEVEDILETFGTLTLRENSDPGFAPRHRAD